VTKEGIVVIVTCTPNPSLDRTVEVDELLRGQVQRLAAVRVHPGGKGVNVARALHRNGHAVHAVVPVGGPEGDQFAVLLAAVGVPTTIVPIESSIRVNVTVAEADGTTTKLNAEGAELSADARERLLTVTIDRAGGEGWVAGCGSLPPGAGDDFYAELVTRGRGAGCRTAIDASGPALAHAVEAGPSLIKPNYHELTELTGARLATFADVVDAARGLCARGVGTVLVSLGVDGALLVTADDVCYGDSEPVAVRSTVGAGDALLAGFLAGGAAGPEALARGLAWASAACRLPGSTMPGPEDLDPDAVRIHDRYSPDRTLKGD
jgi:1-phosphofructokinase